jgi:hypothetical protein
MNRRQSCTGLHRVHVHVRAIARADDAAGDIVCARACPPVYVGMYGRDMYSSHVHMRACML